jgi:hypothetical protein
VTGGLVESSFLRSNTDFRSSLGFQRTRDTVDHIKIPRSEGFRQLTIFLESSCDLHTDNSSYN